VRRSEDPAPGCSARSSGSRRRAIRGGTLKPGTRLPSTRDVARQLGGSRNLAVEAYAQVAAEGYLPLQHNAAVSRLGRGRADSGAKRIAFEDPSNPAQYEITARAGLDTAAIAVDGDGIRVDLPERSGADAVAVTPATYGRVRPRSL
jgi:DNA-binding transcriptional MocR family regulator